MKMPLRIFLSLLLFLSMAQITWAVTAEEQLLSGIETLHSKNFTEKEQGIQTITTSGDTRSGEILQAMLDGRLFFTKSDKTLVISDSTKSKVNIHDALTAENLGTVKKRKLSKITINNQLRGTLKSAIAQINLSNPNPEVRLTAVRALFSDISPDDVGMLTGLIEKEKNSDVKEALQTAVGIARLHAPEAEERLKALDSLQGSLNPDVKNELTALTERETDPAVKHKAELTLKHIESKIAWYSRLETIFFGLSMGSVLVLAAIGLAITFGVIGVINMAHGELIMIGAYTTYVIQQLMPNALGWSIVVAIPAAFLVSGLVGIVIERLVIRFLYGRPQETLLATFGLSLILQQAVRSIFSPLNRSVSTPAWMSGSISINPVLSLTTNRVVILIFALLVFALLFILMKKSSLGLHVRAVSQNRPMARAMGVRAARVDALTFGLGSGIAGIAGVALSQLTNVGPNLGQGYIIDSFMVVVFGGVGNLWGTLLGGLSLGVANKFLEPISGAVLAKIIILLLIILFIQKRPQGLFPQKGRAAE